MSKERTMNVVFRENGEISREGCREEGTRPGKKVPREEGGAAR